jgi:membrane fusion protein
MSQLPASAPETEPSLFRREVLAERETQALGTVLLAPSVPLRLFALFAAFATVAVVALLVFGEYTRTAKVSGWLVPQRGLLRVYTPQPGVVTRLYVQEGSQVDAGKPLIELSTDVQSGVAHGTQAEIARQLAMRRKSLLDDLSMQERLFEDRAADLSERATALRSEMASLERETALQRERLALVQAFANKRKSLLERGLITSQSHQAAEENRLAQAANLLALERKSTTTARELVTLDGELRDLPLTKQAKLAEIQRQIGTLDQEAAATDSRIRIVIPAPQAGTVAMLQAEAGGRADSAAPLLSIIPAGSKLEAHLFSPSRSVGFVRKGQRVRLRYQAFPYQKFGQYDGVVLRVSRSALNPADLNQQLSSLNGLVEAKEPVYRIVVGLNSQTVKAYGAAMPLSPGMQLDASIAMERRTLAEWMFEPLFTVTGGWQ